MLTHKHGIIRHWRAENYTVKFILIKSKDFPFAQSFDSFQRFLAAYNRSKFYEVIFKYLRKKIMFSYLSVSKNSRKSSCWLRQYLKIGFHCLLHHLDIWSMGKLLQPGTTPVSLSARHFLKFNFSVG